MQDLILCCYLSAFQFTTFDHSIINLHLLEYFFLLVQQPLNSNSAIQKTESIIFCNKYICTLEQYNIQLGFPSIIQQYLLFQLILLQVRMEHKQLQLDEAMKLLTELIQTQSPIIHQIKRHLDTFDQKRNSYQCFLRLNCILIDYPEILQKLNASFDRGTRMIEESNQQKEEKAQKFIRVMNDNYPEHIAIIKNHMESWVHTNDYQIEQQQKNNVLQLFSDKIQAQMEISKIFPESSIELIEKINLDHLKMKHEETEEWAERLIPKKKVLSVRNKDEKDNCLGFKPCPEFKKVTLLYLKGIISNSEYQNLIKPSLTEREFFNICQLINNESKFRQQINIFKPSAQLFYDDTITRVGKSYIKVPCSYSQPEPKNFPLQHVCNRKYIGIPSCDPSKFVVEKKNKAFCQMEAVEESIAEMDTKIIVHRTINKITEQLIKLFNREQEQFVEVRRKMISNILKLITTDKQSTSDKQQDQVKRLQEKWKKEIERKKIRTETQLQTKEECQEFLQQNKRQLDYLADYKQKKIAGKWKNQFEKAYKSSRNPKIAKHYRELITEKLDKEFQQEIFNNQNKILLNKRTQELTIKDPLVFRTDIPTVYARNLEQYLPRQQLAPLYVFDFNDQQVLQIVYWLYLELKVEICNDIERHRLKQIFMFFFNLKKYQRLDFNPQEFKKFNRTFIQGSDKLNLSNLKIDSLVNLTVESFGNQDMHDQMQEEEIKRIMGIFYSNQQFYSLFRFLYEIYRILLNLKQKTEPSLDKRCFIKMICLAIVRKEISVTQKWAQKVMKYLLPDSSTYQILEHAELLQSMLDLYDKVNKNLTDIIQNQKTIYYFSLLQEKVNDTGYLNCLIDQNQNENRLRWSMDHHRVVFVSQISQIKDKQNLVTGLKLNDNWIISNSIRRSTTNEDACLINRSKQQQQEGANKQS